MSTFLAKLIKSVKYLKLRDISALFILPLVLIPAQLYKLCLRVSKRSLWVVSEGENDARDNGFTLFEYIRKNYPSKSVYYAINKKSSSYDKVASLGNILHFGGVRHWIYYIAASKNIVTHKSANPNSPLFYVLHRAGILNGHRIFLQHGVTMNNVKYLHYNETRFELFICGAAPEYNYISANFGFDSDKVVYLGFPRFDKLFAAKGSVNKKQIVIMPTWRSWLGRETNVLGDMQLIEDSRYFRTYQSLINNESFVKYIEVHGLTVYFFQHANMEKFANSFTTISSRIKIVTSETADIQSLLAKSGLMITDYSSVSIDFAFMEKPLVYYQFDEDEFRTNHLEEGYFSYRDDGFGPVVDSEEQLLDKVYAYIDNDLEVDTKYRIRSNTFFQLRDGKNSKRIFDKINDLDVVKGLR